MSSHFIYNNKKLFYQTNILCCYANATVLQLNKETATSCVVKAMLTKYPALIGPKYL